MAVNALYDVFKDDKDAEFPFDRVSKKINILTYDTVEIAFSNDGTNWNAYFTLPSQTFYSESVRAKAIRIKSQALYEITVWYISPNSQL